MGKARVEKDTSVKHYYLSKCNDCEHDVRLVCNSEMTDEKLDSIHKRMLCDSCLKKKLDVKK